MNSTRGHRLERFIEAQKEDYSTALSELRCGRKTTHWIWYIFPQVDGLGSSSMAQEYAIKSKEEAEDYLAHEILGARLHQCADALLDNSGKSIEDIMGFPDDLKLKSSMTLFATLSESGSVFHRVLDTFYGGMMDPKTIEFLAQKI
jgi:uncharacterized protein (DUF1810 family)